MPLLIALGGTLREKSRSRAAMQAALAYAQTHGAQTALLDLRALNLPMYNPDFAIEDYPPEHHANLRHFVTTLRQADVLLWATPTYHGTLSGVFKNALDHIELLSEDERPYLAGRAVGLVSINDSLPFEALSAAASELRAWLTPSRVVLSGEDFNPDMTLKTERAQRRLNRIVDDLLDFARAHPNPRRMVTRHLA